MEVRTATISEIKELSELSVRLGNIPFFPGQCKAALLFDDKEIVGFAAAQSAWHAAGSWVHEHYRGKGHTYELRRKLEDELRHAGVSVYFSIPGNHFEQVLFEKYGLCTKNLVQIKRL